LADRESKKREIEMEIFAAQQRREEAVAESNNLVVVRDANWNIGLLWFFVCLYIFGVENLSDSFVPFFFVMIQTLVAAAAVSLAAVLLAITEGSTGP
jgi:hypothetical protein